MSDLNNPSIKELEKINDRLKSIESSKSAYNYTSAGFSTHAVNSSSELINIDIEQSAEAMLEYLKEQLEDEILRTKNLLSAISDQYEAAEQRLEKINNNLIGIKKALDALTGLG